MTKQRELILKIINEACAHYTAEQIFHIAKKILPGIALSTVYNNLNALSEANLIRKICRPGQIDCFDKTTPAHDHLVCAKCGMISDVVLPDLKETLQRSLDCNVISYSLNINYICDNCKHSEVLKDDK